MKKFEEELQRLNRLTLAQLRAEYERTHGEAARSNNRIFLVKRLAWRIQSLEEGGLSERARARAAELAGSALPRQRPNAAAHAAAKARSTSAEIEPALPPEGSCIRRIYKGREIVVTVLRGGIEFEGRMYSSLSAAAKAITGSSWNGRLFFGLAQRRQTP